MKRVNHMLRRTTGIVVAIGVFVSVQLVGAATDFTYIPIDLVGTAYGVNNAGQIVGVFRDVTGSHGLLLDGDTFTPIDVPDAVPGTTVVHGINDSGYMVGNFRDPPPHAPFPRGFLYRDDFELLRFEQAVEVLGINDDGYLVGRSCCERGGNPEGFIIGPDGSRQFFNVPESPWDWASGINSVGQIVGTFLVPSAAPTSLDGLLYLNGVYNPSGETSTSPAELTPGFTFAAYLYSEGEFTRFSVPGASRTDANGINDAGQIVGSYQDGAGSHGFFLDSDGTTFTSIDFPGATSTLAYGINNAGEIVGSYTSSDGTPHAFAAYPTGPQR